MYMTSMCAYMCLPSHACALHAGGARSAMEGRRAAMAEAHTQRAHPRAVQPLSAGSGTRVARA